MSGPHFDFEREAMAQGLRWVAGVDEVGRGPLAGPVGVAAVILDPEDLPEGLDNSNALCEAKRDALRPAIFAKAISVSIVFTSAEEIDLYNIRGPSCAPGPGLRALSLRPHLALFDGRDIPDGLGCPARAIIRGDALSLSIAAASIVAKTTRDALMRNLARESPDMVLPTKSAMTAFHRRALAAAGLCPNDRRWFRLAEDLI